MRRSDREITDIKKLILIMKACDVCRVAFHDNEYPYIVPMNFGLDTRNDKIILYFHGAKEGRKLTLMEHDPHVCFEMDIAHEFIYDKDLSCNSSMKYISIIGNGMLSEVEENEKEYAMDQIMKQYHTDTKFHYDEGVLMNTKVLKLEVQSICGKAR